MFSAKKIFMAGGQTNPNTPPTITITSQPQNTTAVGGEASFAVAATVSDGSELSYQWEAGQITDGGETWTQQSLTHPGPWLSIAYGNNNFVAVSNSQISTTSQDGIRWAHHSMPSGSSWYRIAYGNGTFVAFPFYTTVQSDGHKGALATSPDGINWTKRDLPSGGIGDRFYWRSITHGNERFVAVSTIIGVQETAAVSLDGITWSYGRMPETNGYRVTYGDGKFVAIGYNSNVAATSVDGFNWTKRTLPVSALWDTITYGNGTFVAYGGTGLSYSYILTSTDGVAWMQHLIPDMSNMKSLMYGNGVFVLVGENVAFTSRDGASWTQHPMPSVSLGYSAVTYGGGKFVAIGSGTSAVATSDSDTLQFLPITGETSATLNLTGLTTADDGKQYRVVVDSPSVEPVTSDMATLTVNPQISVRHLVIGGGGGGGSGGSGGGGGAGGYIDGIAQVTTSFPITIAVGAGGSSQQNGENSVFGNLVAIGGGRGGNVYESENELKSGASGGSGGGGSGINSSGGAPVDGQGNVGGVGITVAGSIPPGPAGGGGGGAGGPGGMAFVSGTLKLFGGSGGAGSSSDITGSGVLRAGGGAGGPHGNATGGGGSENAGAGSANSGGGGGWNGGQGGSGVVILRVPSPYVATFSNGVTYTTASVDSDSVYTVTNTSGSETVTFISTSA